MLDNDGYMLAICWVYVGNMLDNAGYLLAICWVYAGYMLGNVLTTRKIILDWKLLSV